jgi:hypothetical protein
MHHVAGNFGRALRSTRDDVIILLMLILGVHQCEIPLLRIATLKRDGGLHDCNCSRECRDSGWHASFTSAQPPQTPPIDNRRHLLETKTCVPITSGSLRTLLAEPGYAAGTSISPKTVRHTHEHVQSDFFILRISIVARSHLSGRTSCVRVGTQSWRQYAGQPE